ncbi:hypothetical protein HPB50_009992 [Hyalomma asiaticum]|uniref:Uncharacterized protein n=1 Tax=Hyalomma asiaticum TaxID=266040 RepID=A0ACB7TLU1_HYAAI|nr:hypothetical protein HPB50_009992 [Hyalomma asiaticum]
MSCALLRYRFRPGGPNFGTSRDRFTPGYRAVALGFGIRPSAPRRGFQPGDGRSHRGYGLRHGLNASPYNSTAAVVTLEGTKLPHFLFYHCAATYVRPYKKTIPACARCSTIGHRPCVCPHPNPDCHVKFGTLAPEGLTKRYYHPKYLLCHSAHETGPRGCTESTGGSRSPRHLLEGLRRHSTTRIPT